MTDITAMVGKTMTRIERTQQPHDGWRDSYGDRLIFTADDGTQFEFFHSQDCCENVYIEDICGDLDTLTESPILLAEEVSSRDAEHLLESREYMPESHTWTFYKFATIKGSVTVRWLGESNGYYSEEVSLRITSSTADGAPEGSH